MKKSVVKSAVIGVMLMASVSVQAQINLGNLGKVLGQAVGGDIASVITGSNNVTQETLAGTWSYQQPSVIFESSNLLKQAGGKLAASAIESKLATQFAKVGITAGKFMIAFTADGTFTTYKDGKTSTSGTYSLDGSKITFSYLQGTANVSGYAQIDNGSLSLTFDSSKLLGVIGKLGSVSGSGTLGTVASLAKSFDGMKSGLQFSKYVAPAVTAKTVAATRKTVTSKKSTKKSTKKSSKKSSKKK